LDFRTSLA
jgi:hypothetical protein